MEFSARRERKREPNLKTMHEREAVKNVDRKIKLIGNRCREGKLWKAIRYNLVGKQLKKKGSTGNRVE